MANREKPSEVSSSDLKNSWHEYLDQVAQGRQEVVVTRYGRPIARLSPYDASDASAGLFGCLAGTVTVQGDIVGPIDELWDADG